MSTFIYDSPSNSRAALEQIMQTLILPMLEELLDAEVKKEVTVDSNLNMRINGTFVGKADKMVILQLKPAAWLLTMVISADM